VIHGGTSLRLSEGDPSPVLEAHPGSPVDISCRRCPSLTTYMPAYSYESDTDYVDGEISPSMNRIEMGIRRGDVAVKGNTSNMNDVVMDDEQTPTQFETMKTFYIPDQVADEGPVHNATSLAQTQDASQAAVMETSWFDFDFGFDKRPRISSNTPGNDSKSSLATTTTTAISGPNNRRFSHGALTVDTSVASSATSMASSATSTYSAVTNTTDVYGWEEELDRRMSIENRLAWDATVTGRATSGGRMTVARTGSDLYDAPYKRGDMKRKGLLHRVLNI
jgi:hypothetical protein